MYFLCVFGKYVRFYVKKDDEPSSVSSPPVQLPNAFTILMAHRSPSRTLPPRIAPARNKKDELHNAIIDWLEKEELAWSPSIECKTGFNTVCTLCDVLWYLDGHYSTLAERSCTVPLVFHQFSGYNRPELSKHRKRKVGALCAESLRSHSQRLFGNLQGVFWNTGTWVKFKSEVELLAKSLAKYADMLSSKRVAMSLVHSSQQPVRSVGNSMSVLYIAPRHSPSSDLAQISSTIIRHLHSLAPKKCQDLKSHRNTILNVRTVPSPESQERSN